MTVEIIIIVSLILLFVLILRRLPDVIKRPKQIMRGAINDLPKPIAQNMDMNKSFFEIANGFFSQGNYQEAEKFYLKAAAKEPKNPRIYNRLGIIYLEQKNFRDAKEAFAAALKLDDKKASRHVNYGLACLNLKNFHEAIKSLESAIKLDPKNKKYQTLLIEAKSKKKLVENK